MNVIVIDNYDSFTYNLVQYLGELKQDVKVYRNDEITLEEIKNLKPSHIVISPGPGRPTGAGISNDLIKEFGGKIPILGVCLGHQCIGEVFGGKVTNAPTLMHGKTSEIFHEDNSIFTGIPSPFTATRYHSLIVDLKFRANHSAICFRLNFSSFPSGLPKCPPIITWAPLSNR